MSVLYRVAGDVGAPPVGVTLYDDGVVVDLSAETIVCSLRNTVDGAVTDIGGLTGTVGGVVSTPLSASSLVAGRYTMEWEVTGGATYPAEASARPILIVRTEVS